MKNKLNVKLKKRKENQDIQEDLGKKDDSYVYLITIYN